MRRLRERGTGSISKVPKTMNCKHALQMPDVGRMAISKGIAAGIIGSM